MKRLAAIEGMECLFSSTQRCGRVHLTCAGSRSGAFVRECLPGVLVQEVAAPSPLDFLTNDEEVARKTGLADAMRSCGADALMLAEDSSPALEAWASRNAVSLASTPWAVQGMLEDKVSFQAMLDAHGISTPKAWVLRSREDALAVDAFPAVVQDPAPHPAYKLSVVRSPEELEEVFVRQSSRAPLLCRAFAEGLPLGVSILVGKHETVFSALRLQCFSEEHGEFQEFLGLQWVPSAAVSGALTRSLEHALGLLADALRGEGFLGVANVDFIARGDEPLLLECNPRMSAATPCIAMLPELLHGLDFCEEFLRAIAGERLSADIRRLPETAFEGSLIQFDFLVARLARQAETVAVPPVGFYALHGGVPEALPSGRGFGGGPSCFFFSGLPAEAPASALRHLGVLVANVPLFTPSHAGPPRLNPAGRALLSSMESRFLATLSPGYAGD